MKYLFLEPQQPSKLTLENAFISKDLPVKCSFENGWFCKKCNNVTEHIKIDGAQVCKVCKTPKVPCLPSQVLEHRAFINSIVFYSAKIELDAIEKVFGSSFCGECEVVDWMHVRAQLRSNKELEEVIVNAKV